MKKLVLAMALSAAMCLGLLSNAVADSPGTASGQDHWLPSLAQNKKDDFQKNDGVAYYQSTEGSGWVQLEGRQAVPNLLSDAQGRFVAFNVYFLGEAGITRVNPYYFTATTSQGFTVDVDLGVDGQLPALELQGGRRAGGIIQFDVPQGVAIDTVTFSDPLGSELALWSITM